MAEPSTIARPYAEAAFRLADEKDQLAAWSASLAELAGVAADPRVARAIRDPNLPAAKLAGLIIAILAGRLSSEMENLVRVLAGNGRLDVLGEIRTQFEALKNEREGTVEAQIVSAYPLEAPQLAELVARLERRIGRRVKARVSVERELLGGVRIILGDTVIDGSVRAQLGALELALKA